MAAVERVFSFADVDVFTIPHHRMKQLLHKVSNQVKETDYSNHNSFFMLLKEISSTFMELKQHEEIENKYIMKILKRKLQGEALRKLLVHLHANSHISEILKQVRIAEEKFQNGICTDFNILGSSLNIAIQNFFEEYVPHMKEEEQVLQPMLMEFLPVHELHRIKEIVLQLHCLKHLEEKQVAIERPLLTDFDKMQLKSKEEEGVSIWLSLPENVLASILSYLNPQDLCRCAQVCSSWNEMAYTGSFWKTLQPSRWGRGDWRFGNEFTSDDCNCDCEPNYNLMTFLKEDSDVLVESSSGTDSSLDEEMEDKVKKENKILHGIARYLIPRVGEYVKTLVMECSKAVTNGLMFRILSQCRNLEYLDVSQTIISDLGLIGLFKNGCPKLKYLDVSGCKQITDVTLNKLSLSMGKLNNNNNNNNNNKQCASCNCKRKTSGDQSAVNPSNMRLIHTLRLSGCYRVTDVGLRSLSKYGGLPALHHLDLSGCFNVTNSGIEELLSTCPDLDMEQLFYCDNIVTESYDDFAGGCQNNGCRHRVCCRTGL